MVCFCSCYFTEFCSGLSLITQGLAHACRCSASALSCHSSPVRTLWSEFWPFSYPYLYSFQVIRGAFIFRVLWNSPVKITKIELVLMRPWCFLTYLHSYCLPDFQPSLHFWSMCFPRKLPTLCSFPTMLVWSLWLLWFFSVDVVWDVLKRPYLCCCRLVFPFTLFYYVCLPFLRSVLENLSVEFILIICKKG